jgi:beta-phosphoglucomutase-like phosphatase (HAD superfamily)
LISPLSCSPLSSPLTSLAPLPPILLQATLIEPVMDIVRAAQAKGLPIAVCSGGTSWHVDQILTETNIKSQFMAIVTGGDVARGKPAPDGFLLAAEKIGVPPHLCVG